MVKSLPSQPLCYRCIYRRDVPGSAHSGCVHPKAGGNDPGLSALAILASVGRMSPVADVVGADALNISANPHGIRNGWFNWPFNFDPVWLANCDGFTSKESQQIEENQGE